MSLDWRSAFAAQARSDYKMLRRLLGDDGADLCQQLHYLQMTAEKLAKAFSAASGGPPPPMSHNAFLEFVRTSRTRRDIQRACGFTDHRHFAAYLRSLLETAERIEDLYPQGIDHPNPEHPWTAGGAIYAPVGYPFSELNPRGPKVAKMLEFIASCFSIL